MKFTKHTLPNGLRVILVPEPQSLAATVLVLVEAGSNYETKQNNGISHFLEHMCFKGTEKRPRAIDISSELDAMGAHYNAFTSNEYTGYYAKVQPKYFDRALDIVADIYLNPRFEPAEIEKEKGVIVEEINMYEDLPQQKVQEMILEALYGDQPAGWPVAGRKEIVRAVTREDFLAYRTKQYSAPSTIVVCAGNFDEARALEGVKQQFAGIHDGTRVVRRDVTEKQTAPKLLVKEKKSDQTHLVIAFRGVDASHADRFAYGVLGAILGGGMSSRLFQKVREEMGAAYYVGASHDSNSNYGYMSASAGADTARAEDVITAILGECKKLKAETVGEKELTMVKDMMVGNFFLSLETSNQHANYLGGQEVVRGEIVQPEEIAEKIQAVTADDVQRVARECFVPEKLNFALIGPSVDEKRFAALLTL